jgi:prenyltransferase beta subunit
MLQVARLAPSLLQEAADRVADFFLSQLNDDGGARDKSGKSDLYYTVFVLDGLVALQKELPVDRVKRYLEKQGDGAKLDLVHQACLARCWAALPKGSFAHAEKLADRLEKQREDDGGFGSLYLTFVAQGALEDLGRTPKADGIASMIGKLEQSDGGYSNNSDIPAATTPTTAGGVTLLHHLGAPVPPKPIEYLRARYHPEGGGFRAVPLAPIPDLLSTATALHALVAAHASIAEFKEKTLDFVDSLWTGQGFCGNWDEEKPDAEYTFYALLSLGHLSL